MASRTQQWALVALSFGQRDFDLEPGPINRRLGSIAARYVRGLSSPTLVVAQWEIALEMGRQGVPVDFAVYPEEGVDYIDTGDVWRQARQFLDAHDIERVALLAHPFLHRSLARHIIRRDGYMVQTLKTGMVGFDPDARNRQWWTRGPVRLMTYSALRAAGISRQFHPTPVEGVAASAPGSVEAATDHRGHIRAQERSITRSQHRPAEQD